MPCFYCLDPKTSISVCLGCRSRLESTEAALKTALRDLQWLRRENARLRSAVAAQVAQMKLRRRLRKPRK